MPTDLHPAPAAGSDAVTPTYLIGEVRVARVRREEAEHEVLALEWATVHEVQGPGRRERDADGVR